MPSERTGTLRRILGRWTFVDQLLVWIIAAYGAVVAVGVLIAPRFLIPAEDAIILFQYSRNLALHGAINYNPAGPHAEGATDFLWMILISAGMKLRAHPFWIVSVLNFISLGVIAWLLIRIAGKRFNLLAACFIAGVFGLLPQVMAAVSGFSVLPFGALLLLLIFCFLQDDIVAFPAVALLLCLFRPDGVVFAIPMLIAALLLRSNRGRRLFWDFALFVLPGLAYFFWRWHYFGSLLPLPFLVKSDTHRVAHFLVMSSVSSAKPLLFFSLILLWVVLHRNMRDTANRVVLACIVLLPNLFYLAMRLDQNIGRRFFIFLPIGTAALIAMNWQRIGPRLATVFRTAIILWFILMCKIWNYEITALCIYQFDNRKAIAEDLARLPHGTLLVTEAGIAAYYSGWTTYDAWGLNTKEFAFHFLQPSDISRINPDLMLVYTPNNTEECVPHADWKVPYTQRQWTFLIRNIIAGADDHYDLRVVPFGNTRYRAHLHQAVWQGDHECWLIRKDAPQHDQIDAVLHHHGAMTFSQFETLRPPSPQPQASEPPSPAHPSPAYRLHMVWRKTIHTWWDWLEY